MAMTLRTTEDQDRTLDRLAALYGLSKHQVVLLAIQRLEEAAGADIQAKGRASLARWPHVYEALKNT